MKNCFLKIISVQDECDEIGVQCNCDILDGRPHEDKGTITRREHLPLTSMHLIQGQIGSNPKTRLKLGSLECSKTCRLNCYTQY